MDFYFRILLVLESKSSRLSAFPSNIGLGILVVFFLFIIDIAVIADLIVFSVSVCCGMSFVVFFSL